MADDPSEISVTNFRVASTVLPVLACIVTVFRLGVRTRSRLWWWDDSCALLSMLCILGLVGGLWTHTADPASLTRASRIAGYYISALFFYATNWAARLSILCTVVRIAPFPRQKKWLGYVAIAFVLGWAFLSIQTIIICEKNVGDWKNLPSAQCPLGDQSGIAQLVPLVETSADMILVGIPMHFFRSTALKRNLKVRLIAVFSTSAITTIGALIHGAFVLRVGGLIEATAAMVEDAVALAVCNLSVIVPVIARLCNGGGVFDPQSEDIALSNMQGSSSGTPSANGVHVARTVLIAAERGPDIPVGLDGDSSQVWQTENKDNSEYAYTSYLPKTSIP